MTLALRWAVVRAILLFHYGIDTEIRVSTESWPWRRIVFCRSWWDSNPQPFNFESSALPLSYLYNTSTQWSKTSFKTQSSTTEQSALYNTSTHWTKTSFKTQSPTQVQGRRKTWNWVFENALLWTLFPLSTTEPACMFVYFTVPNRNSIRMAVCLCAYVHVCVRTCRCVLCLCVRVCAYMRLVCVCCGLSVCLCMHVYIQ